MTRQCCGVLKKIDRTFIKHLCILSFLTFFVVLPILSSQLHFSWYSLIQKRNIDKDRENMRQENNARLKDAISYLDLITASAKHDIPPYVSANFARRNKTDVGITIITVSRNHHDFDTYQPRYLTQNVAFFLRLFNESRDIQVSFKLFICDVDKNPLDYIEVNNLSKIVPTFQRFPMKAFTNYDLHILEKEKQDYVYCGEQTLKQNVSYVFLVEDDALPHKSLLYITNEVINKYIGSDNEKNISYIKFYHPNRLLGYISLEVERLPELFGSSLILTSFLVFIYRRCRYPSLISNSTLWIGFFTFSALLFLSIGRLSLLRFREISRHFYEITPAPSCCTPAILYPKKGMENVIQYLKSVHCKKRFGKDIALDEYTKKFKLVAKLIQPNLFTHVGMYSSLRKDILDPAIV